VGSLERTSLLLAQVESALKVLKPFFEGHFFYLELLVSGLDRSSFVERSFQSLYVAAASFLCKAEKGGVRLDLHAEVIEQRTVASSLEAQI